MFGLGLNASGSLGLGFWGLRISGICCPRLLGVLGFRLVRLTRGGGGREVCVFFFGVCF